MLPKLNLCSAVLPGFDFYKMMDIAIDSGFEGIELRVHEHGHVTLPELENHGADIKNKLAERGLDVAVLNSYIPVEDKKTVGRILDCCKQLDIKKTRLVLPRSCNASVSRQANIKELLPSYIPSYPPQALMKNLRFSLKQLEQMARNKNVKILLELHWGTVMSSFSSAYHLLNGLDPEYLSLTFDPANMIVEGKEDWEFGINLTLPYIDNIHVKNTTWNLTDKSWQWSWASLSDGMVDWHKVLTLLGSAGYNGDYSLEDFLVPQDNPRDAVDYLVQAKDTFLKSFPAQNQKAA